MTAARSAGTMRVAAVQTVSGSDVDANLAAVEPLIVAAKEQGAALTARDTAVQSSSETPPALSM